MELVSGRARALTAAALTSMLSSVAAIHFEMRRLEGLRLHLGSFATQVVPPSVQFISGPLYPDAVLDAKLIVESEDLGDAYGEWDALASTSALPRMTPGWMLAWWQHLAPKDSLLRVVEVRDGTRLVGLAPFVASPARWGGRTSYRLAGDGAPLAPLALPGRERQVAEAVGGVLAEADPPPDLLEFQGMRLDTPWRAAIRDGWPGRARPVCRVYRTQICPTVSFGEQSVEAWLAGRSAKFRNSMRRLRGRFEEAGGKWRLASEATLAADLDSFLRLHADRWQGRGDSTIVRRQESVRAMLNDAGRALMTDERFRLWLTEIDGVAIGADIYLADGGTVCGINGGWDERWKQLSPPLLMTMHTIEDAIDRGESQLDLGPGGGSHKTRFTKDESPVAWTVLMVPGRRLVRTYALTAPRHVGSRARGDALRVLGRDRAGGRVRAPRRQDAAARARPDGSARTTNAPLRSAWRFAAAAGALSAAAAHLPVAEDNIYGGSYLGLLFILLSCGWILLAGQLIRRDTRAAWRALAGLCALGIGLLAWSRVIGPPPISDDVGRWTEPLAIVAACAEVVVLVLSGLALSGWAVGARFVRGSLSLALGVACLAAGLAATAYAAVLKYDRHGTPHPVVVYSRPVSK